MLGMKGLFKSLMRGKVHEPICFSSFESFCGGDGSEGSAEPVSGGVLPARRTDLSRRQLPRPVVQTGGAGRASGDGRLAGSGDRRVDRRGTSLVLFGRTVGGDDGSPGGGRSGGGDRHRLDDGQPASDGRHLLPSPGEADEDPGGYPQFPLRYLRSAEPAAASRAGSGGASDPRAEPGFKPAG